MKVGTRLRARVLVSTGERGHQVEQKELVDLGVVRTASSSELTGVHSRLFWRKSWVEKTKLNKTEKLNK